MHLKHARHVHSPAIQAPQHNTMTATSTRPMSTKLYDAACVAAEKARALRDKANETRFNATRLSVSDELHWYNNHTNWDALTRKEFRDVMVRMESITTQFYHDFGDCVYPNRSAAIRKFWADEWDCEYLPQTGEWWDLSSNERIESETEKKAKRDLNKAQAKAEKKAQSKAEKKAQSKAEKKEKKEKHPQTAQCNDDEDELYMQSLQQMQAQTQQQTQQQTYRTRFDAEEEAYEKLYVQAKSVQSQSQKAKTAEQALAETRALEAQIKQEQQQQQQQQQQLYDYDCWYDAEEEAYAEAYAKARAADALKEQQEAEAYLAQHATRITCQPVFYFEELTDVQGDPDWRAYIYYDQRIRRYVFKGTRRSLLNYNKKKTSFPEVKLCFRSSGELASFLHSSTDTLNITMFAMASATVRDATFAELYALPARGSRTELFGYDQTRPRYSTFVNYLRTLRDVDVSHSTFAAF